MFLEIGPDSFGRYHVSHCLRIAFVVVPLMLLEFATAAWLVWMGGMFPLLWVSFGFMALIWASTFLMQVSVHNRLTVEGWSELWIRKLIQTNWVRTLAWTARGLILAGLSFG